MVEAEGSHGMSAKEYYIGDLDGAVSEGGMEELEFGVAVQNSFQALAPVPTFPVLSAVDVGPQEVAKSDEMLEGRKGEQELQKESELLSISMVKLQLQQMRQLGIDDGLCDDLVKQIEAKQAARLGAL